jgi:hypothetical protein
VEPKIGFKDEAGGCGDVGGGDLNKGIRRFEAGTTGEQSEEKEH